MIAINWYGPYDDLDEARESARYDYEHGLYLAIGECEAEQTAGMQYIGIGEAIHARLNEGHHKLSLILRKQEFWLGEIA